MLLIMVTLVSPKASAYELRRIFPIVPEIHNKKKLSAVLPPRVVKSAFPHRFTSERQSSPSCSKYQHIQTKHQDGRSSQQQPLNYFKMKAADYRIPWGRPSEHLIAVERELMEHKMHIKRVYDARHNQSMVDSATPKCASMPHLIARPKKKQMQEDRQREIAAENHSLMQRLAGIMKAEMGEPVPKYAHLSVEYLESLRRKKLLKLEAENRRLAHSIRNQKSFYPAREMEKAEGERQALLKTMSRTQRRKDRVAHFAAIFRASRGVSDDEARGTHSAKSGRTIIGSPGPRGGRPQSYASSLADVTRLVENGVVFRPGPSTVKLRTARQMRLEIARRRGKEPDDTGQRQPPRHASQGTNHTVPRCSQEGLVVRRSSAFDDIVGDERERNQGVILEANRTGGSRRTRGGISRARSGEGRPNMIFTPSLIPVGMESVRAHSVCMVDGSIKGCEGGSAASTMGAEEKPPMTWAPATNGEATGSSHAAKDLRSASAPSAGANNYHDKKV